MGPGLLTEQKLFQLLEEVVKDVCNLLPGDTEKAKKAWVAKQLTSLLDAYENTIPVIGALLNVDAVDEIEEHAISMFVDWTWDQIEQQVVEKIESV
jgi:hypothetical protein